MSPKINIYVTLLVFCIYDGTNAECEIEVGLPLQDGSGTILFPSESDSTIQNCVWNFPENLTEKGDAIVMQIQEMKLGYWGKGFNWCAAELLFQGQNICDFEADVCFIIAPRFISCNMMTNVTSTCKSIMWSIGPKSYPPKLSFKKRGSYYDEENKFKIKYSYINCNQESTQSTRELTTSPPSERQYTSDTTIITEQSTRETHSSSSTTEKQKYDKEIGGNNHNVIIVLGILCGILALISFALLFRLCNTSRKTTAIINNDLQVKDNKQDMPEDPHDMPLYSTVDKTKKLKSANEKVVVANELYSTPT